MAGTSREFVQYYRRCGDVDVDGMTITFGHAYAREVVVTVIG
jgi:hypothetical protein